jgi:hypothetical protein
VLSIIKKIVITLLVVLIVAIAAGRWYLYPARGPKLPVNPNEKGYVETIEGTMVLHLKGTPYEMGYQHGALASERAKKVEVGFNQLIERAKREVGLPTFASKLILDVVYRMCLKHIPERLQREMEGIADGAGIDLQTLHRMHAVSEVTERNCSVFAVWGKATKDGKMYFGRNFDWMMDGGMQDAAALILYEPEEKGMIPFASAGYIGLVGVLSGMNMDGVAIGQIGAVTRDQSFAGLPLMLVMRRIVEECHNVDEATAILTKVKRTVGYNYVVADAKANTARAYETCAHHCAVFKDNDPKETVEYALPIENAVFRADEAMDQTVRSFQACSKGYPNLPYGCNSYDHRYKGMATRIKDNYGRIDSAVALDITKAVAMRDTNLHAVMCNVTDHEIWVAHAKGAEDAWKQPFIRYKLNQLFKRPEDRQSQDTGQHQ